LPKGFQVGQKKLSGYAGKEQSKSKWAHIESIFVKE
jgi:hypothetical protein